MPLQSSTNMTQFWSEQTASAVTVLSTWTNNIAGEVVDATEPSGVESGAADRSRRNLLKCAAMAMCLQHRKKYNSFFCRPRMVF